MAHGKQASTEPPAANPVASDAARVAPATGAPAAVAVLAVALFVAPAIGVAGEHMLQDTLKSIVVSFATLAAAALLAWRLRGATQVRWHAVLWLPLLLAGWALGSMAWSHAYLAGVEAARWTIFALLLWVGLNVLDRERLPWLATGIHAGAVVASLWAALQFWVEFDFFRQGPGPASTFINRNFFAEFAVCTLPFSALLLGRVRQSAAVAAVAGGTTLTVVAILMTGTRSAIITLAVLVPVLVVGALRGRSQLAWPSWPRPVRALAALVLVGGTVGLGLVPSNNDRILQEGRGATALERAFTRTSSVSAADTSVRLRMEMWKNAASMAADRPLTGVGAGAWEVLMPLYQSGGAEVETDYYVHNEPLQLLAEYGLVGALFLAGLVAYLLRAGVRTWRSDAASDADMPWRVAALASLLALLLVSNAGFPWRMAATGALFALSLGVLLASDARAAAGERLAARAIRWPRLATPVALASIAAATVLAGALTHRAAQAEYKLVEAARLALDLARQPDREAPRWAETRAQILRLADEGIALHPHYRKITPQIADAMVSWGDWKNAIRIWESVIESRPFVVAILTNIARGYAQTGDPERAGQFLARAERIAPLAPSVLSTKVILLAGHGQDRQAAELASQAIARGRYDLDLLRFAIVLGWRTGDATLVEQAGGRMVTRYPHAKVDGHLQLADFYWRALKDEPRSLLHWRAALEAAGPQRREELLDRVPAPLRQRVQTSASSS